MSTVVYKRQNTGHSFLIVVENHEIRTYDLSRRTSWTIGRQTQENFPNIPFKSMIVGRKHGQLYLVNGTWFYEDGGSINGTIHNEDYINSRECNRRLSVQLKDGDILKVDSRDMNSTDARGVTMFFTTNPMSGSWTNYRLPTNKEVVIGRNSNCDIVLNYGYISKVHAKILYYNGAYYVLDSQSKAGTWLNGQKLSYPVRLKDRDKITLCDCVFIYLGGYLVYNQRNRAQNRSSRSVLQADIISKKVPNRNGHGKKELIRNIRLDIKEGTLVALLGGSGAGKSTVMNCLNGMDTAGMEGTVLFYGEDLIKNFQRFKYLIGSVPQDNCFQPMLTVEEHLKEAALMRLPSSTSKAEIQKRVDTLIRQLGLQSVRKNVIQKCSGGEKQRVNMGIDLVADKMLFCLDEPDRGLDPQTKKDLFTVLKNLAHQERKSFLVIIHDVSEIDLFDQVIMLAKVDGVGRLAFSGTPQVAKQKFNGSIKNAYDMIEKEPGKYIVG